MPYKKRFSDTQIWAAARWAAGCLHSDQNNELSVTAFKLRTILEKQPVPNKGEYAQRQEELFTDLRQKLNAVMLFYRPGYTEKQKKKFAWEVVKGLREEAKRYPFVELRIDTHPEGVLRDAAIAAGIPIDDHLFPIKTTCSIRPDGKVIVKQGEKESVIFSAQQMVALNLPEPNI